MGSTKLGMEEFLTQNEFTIITCIGTSEKTSFKTQLLIAEWWLLGMGS